MSITEIKSEMENLPAEALRELTAFLMTLRHREDKGYARRMAEKIDDTTPDGWVTLDEFDEKLGFQ